MPLLFHVQHLLGIGHVRRAAALVRALAASGFEVTVASGGFPVPGIDFAPARLVQLPPARAADAGFRRLVDEREHPLDAPWREHRRQMLLNLHDRLQPAVVLVESFPFGRRAFAFELEPLLAAVAQRRPKPLVACSVRDILVTKRNPARLDDMVDTARRHFDLVLVHGDPALIGFEASFPPAARIADLIRYTGYVAPPPPESDARGNGRGDGDGEVIVSCGGGAVGLPLLELALATRPLLRQGDAPLATAAWRLLAGFDLPEPDFRALAAKAPPGVTVERARADFPALLRRCRVSVSQGGYNTLLDVLQAGCPAVIVPFEAPGETEQRQRTDLLAARGLVGRVDGDPPTAPALAAAITAALTRPPTRLTIDRHGAIVTADLLRRAAGRR